MYFIYTNAYKNGVYKVFLDTIYTQMSIEIISFCPTKRPTLQRISFLYCAFCPTKRPTYCPTNHKKAAF